MLTHADVFCRLKPSYATDLALLASRLMAIARQHSLDLQVGMCVCVCVQLLEGLRAYKLVVLR